MVESIVLPLGRVVVDGCLVFECEVDVVIFALASNTKSSCLDAGEDDSD